MLVAQQYWSRLHFYKWVVCLVSVLCSLAVAAREVNVPGDYATIQDAVDAIAGDRDRGDTIVVAVGTYTESVKLIDDITIRGEETALTQIEPDTEDDAVFDIDGVDNVTLQHLTFIGSGTGVVVTDSANVTIRANVFNMAEEATAVSVTDISSVAITNNTFYDAGTAINRKTDATVIQNNIFVANGTPIAPDDVTDNVSYNCFYDNDTLSVLGSNAVTDLDPLFVNIALRDFHLRAGSPCINAGIGTDNIDETAADLGAYGGSDADVALYPVQSVVATEVTATSIASIDISWSANLDYRVAGYNLYYDSDAPGAPYSGVDGNGATAPSPVRAGNVLTLRLTDLRPITTPPVSPVLRDVIPSNGRLTAVWEAVAGATSYTVYYGTNAVTENSVSAVTATSYTINGLTNDVVYQVAVQAVLQPRYYVAVTAYDASGESDHESRYSTEASVTMGSPLSSVSSNVVTAIPELTIPVPNLPSEGCFIATAAFGFYDAPQVHVLREFRDRYLLRSSAGRAFVDWYYAHSPDWAHTVAHSPGWRAAVRLMLWPLIEFAQLVSRVGLVLASLITMFALFLFSGLVYRLLGRCERWRGEARVTE